VIKKFTFLFFILFGTSKLFAQCNPALPSIINVIDDSVTVAWNAVTGALGYEYVILPSTSPQPASGTSTTALGFGMNGLQYQSYKAWLRSDCGSSVFSNWSYVTFTIVCGSPAIALAALKDTSADFTWPSISGTASYEYVIDQVSGNPTGAGTPLSGTTIHIGGLSGGNTYYMHIRTKCNSTAFSSWATQPFTTPYPAGIDKETRSRITINPNPVISDLNFELPEAKGNVIITNMAGTIVYRAPVTANKFSLDMSTYPSGVYLLRYINAFGLQTIKLTKL
jgi:hypothetical protein